MIVERMTMHVAPTFKMKAWVEALKSNLDQAPNPGFYRIYTSLFGPSLMVVSDLEFESEEEQAGWWKEWVKRPEHAAISQASRELEVEFISREIWTLVE